MLALHAPHIDKLDPDSISDELSENDLSDSLEEEYYKALGIVVVFSITDLF